MKTAKKVARVALHVCYAVIGLALIAWEGRRV
jgi:hypothetical protein